MPTTFSVKWWPPLPVCMRRHIAAEPHTFASDGHVIQYSTNRSLYDAHPLPPLLRTLTSQHDTLYINKSLARHLFHDRNK